MGGSSLDFRNKRQRRDYYKRVHSIAAKGQIVKTRWSHIPITFTEADLNLKCYPHTDAMVIDAHIAEYQVTKSSSMKEVRRM